MNNTAEELKDTLNDIERDAYDGVDIGDMFTKAYVLADELGESIDKPSEENIKLRELLADTLIDPRGYCAKYGIDYDGWDSANDDIDRRLRELGIEVK